MFTTEALEGDRSCAKGDSADALRRLCRIAAVYGDQSCPHFYGAFSKTASASNARIRCEMSGKKIILRQ
jgi:hypothetical protein|tara:strand:+ start:185 stop:391 length:207 start_codon:yes stop_codon:yes gene_type:complete